MNTRTSSSDDELTDESTAPPDACPHCDGMGFVIPDVPPAHPSFGRAVPCVCQIDAQESRRNERLITTSQLGLLRECKFETFMAEGLGLNASRQRNLKMVYDRCVAYANEPAGWLMLRGGYGCGKTHLAAAIANHQLDSGRPVLFINTPDLLDHLRAAFSPSSPIGYDKRSEEVRNTPLLILDDLGTQSNTEWAQEKLYQIFNHRYNARLPTVITTNQELEALEIRVRSRIADPSLTQILTILAPDFRRAGVAYDRSELSTLEFHREKSFQSFDLREQELPRAQAENLRRAMTIAQEFSEQPADWLVLNSIGFGNGKTHLAAAIANAVANRGEDVLFVVVPDLLDHLRASFNPASGQSLDKRFEEVKRAPLLVLDDLGTESATAWAREKLYQLFNYRYNARLPTVITTATPIDEIDERLRTRMLDGSRCSFFVLEVPSYRGGIRTRRGRKSSGRGG